MVVPNPAFDEAVGGRAVKLCTEAEPHTDAPPCFIHLAEARRQLFDAWLGQ